MKYLDEWIEELESGKYLQTRDCLHNEEGYCCLGVYAQILIEREGFPGWEITPTNTFSFMGWDKTLSKEVQERVGLDRMMMFDLAEMNDLGASFERIARALKDYRESRWWQRVRALFEDEEGELL